MTLSRRTFLGSSLALAAGCTKPVTKPSFEERLARGRKKAVEYLLANQAKDGAWRSDVYGTFKDGTGLTPLVLNALLASSPEQEQAVAKSARYLANFIDPKGEPKPPEYGFDFALYMSALTVTAFCHPKCPSYPKQRDAWLDYLRRRQLTEERGWKPTDREYGGWGYSRGVPHKPKEGELIPPLTESNLSATTFALEALHAAKVPKDDPLWKKATVFIHRCQNWRDDEAEPKFDDGGFFFIYDDPVRNKAGVAGKDRTGHTRYHSYGSTTCDGLRCLIYTGHAKDHPRRVAARKWLLTHFTAKTHPGTYAKSRERDRESVYHYYASSFSKTPLADSEIEKGVTRHRQLVEALLARQRPDGSWRNAVDAVRENDPITATAFALWAIG